MDPKGGPQKRRYTLSNLARRKRLKIPIACGPCRRRKVKCDGARPACWSCQRRAKQAECVYSQKPDEPATALEEEEEAEAEAEEERRLSPLLCNPPEDVVGVSNQSRIVRNNYHPRTFSTHRWSPKVTNSVHTCGSGGAILPASTSAPVPGSSSSGKGTIATHSSRLVDSPAFTEPTGTDSMNGVTGDPTRTPEVFGSSSAGSFMRQIQSAINARLGVVHANLAAKNEAASQQSHSHLDSQPSSSGYGESALLLLPPRGLADSLMRAYWDNNWSLYPVIDRGKIEPTYESLWTAHTARNYPLIPVTVINLCFAIGCYYCELLPPRERKATSDDFFARAELLYKKTGEALSYERVQCLLLFGIYLQSTTSVSKCWMTVGQAVRMAQSLGIHLTHHDHSRETASQRAYQRRTWHGCVWLDRVLSSTLGRPGMIPKWLFNSIPLPSMIDDEFLDAQTIGSPFRPDGRPCKMAFFVKALELYQILDEILVDLYLKNAKDEGIESKLIRILQIDGKLQAWNKALPEHLHPRHAAEGDEILKRQAIVLRVRFLHARILLFRQTVISYCMRGSTAAVTAGCCTENKPDDSSDDFSLSEVMLAQCARISFRIAHELIETFDRHLDRQTLLGPLPNWWYSVLYVYNATMMILVERFLEAKESASDRVESKAERTWHAALRVLKSYGVLADSATRCVAVLEIFLEKLFLSNSNSNNGNNDSTDTAAVATAQRGLDDYDWDAMWAMSNSFGQEFSLSDSNLFPFTFDDFILSDLLSAPSGQDRCWTCKARKVKCDENPLGCASCARLGVTCGGYDIKLQWISSDAGRRPHRDLSARIGRRRIGAGWTGILQFNADEIDEFLLRVNEADRGVSTTHGPFSVFPVDRNGSNHGASPASSSEQELSRDSNGAAPLVSCLEGSEDELNPDGSNYKIPSSPSGSSVIPVDTLSPPSRNAPTEVDEYRESDFHLHLVHDNEALQTLLPEDVNNVDTDIVLNATVPLLQQPQMFLSSNRKTNELFHHYVANVAEILLPVSHPGNPYRSLYAPAALEGSLYFESGLFDAAPNIGLCIFHSLISTSAFHLHRCHGFNSEYHRLGIMHRQVALQSLQMVLMKEVPVLDYKTLLVALLSMVTIGVMEGSIIDFRVHLQGISNFQAPRRKWQLISADTRQLNTQSAFLNLLARTTSPCIPSPWVGSRDSRHREHDSLTATNSRSFCHEFTYGVTADIAAAILETITLYECLEFYREAQESAPDDLLQACEDLGDRLLSWTLGSDKVPSFSDKRADEFDIFKHHSHAWHGAALTFYLNCIQGAKAQDLVDEVATVASHMLAVEEIKSRHVTSQMAPISWPAFIASCCALDREHWETWWLEVQKYGIGSIRRQYSIVQEIWSEMDTDPSKGWLQILHERNIQVLAA
ncbi:hypothetical protein ABOM_003368 [Aspergillus bombycis]|uniref:Zn(2)-C6 fungal-type domain-containing protein n=1 Tax=Aspergillus bombycis TaxID=109264 RepID=A0A1F8A9G9_9EURO|nr:hypothetical protein ABOM_003368 [Aspergillus bombycis]OGM48376.1 hypothetical protein ABOM_003368 [Aspergillus bombycis]